MKTSLAAFLGITNGDIDGEFSAIRSGLAKSADDDRYTLTFQGEKRLITLSLKDSSFRLYVTIIENTHSTIKEWKEMAKDFRLPFSAAPVPESEWPLVALRLNAGSPLVQYLTLSIFDEMKKAGITAILMIPSV